MDGSETALVTQQQRRDEDHQFIGQALAQEGGDDAPAALDQQMGPLSSAQLLQQRTQVDSPPPARQGKHLRTRSRQGAGHVGRGILARGHDHGGEFERLKQPAGRWDLQVGVEDDAGGLSAGAAAVGQLRVVVPDRADAHAHAVAHAAEPVHAPPGRGARDPLAVAGVGGDPPVEALGPLADDPGPGGGAELDVGGEQAAGLVLHDSGDDLDPAAAQRRQALAADVFVGVFHGCDHPGDLRLEDGFGAGRGLAVVAAGLQGDVQGRPGRVGPGRASGRDGLDLGVRAAETAMVAFAQDLPVADDDRADHGIGLDGPAAQGGQLQRPGHELLMLAHGGDYTRPRRRVGDRLWR